MWVLAIIGIIVFIIIVNSQDDSAKGSSMVKSPPPMKDDTAFSLKVSQGTKVYDSESLPVLSFSMRGLVSAPHDNYPAKLMLTLSDVTDKNKEGVPILTNVQQLQFKDTVLFCFESQQLELPYMGTIFSKWTDVSSVPIDLLIFPRRGSRRLEATLHVCSDDARGQIIATAQSCVTCDIKDVGYEEKRENRSQIERLIVTLAMAISAADGSLDPEEGHIVKEWIIRRSELYKTDDAYSKAKARLNKAVRDSVALLESGDGIQPYNACQELVSISDLGDRYDALELCLQVAAADGVATKDEMDVMHTLAEWLEVDFDRYKSMTEKIVPIIMHEVQDMDDILGFKSEMSIDDKKRHLRKLYKKWSALVTHSDEKQRKQAKHMLGVIAEERSKLDKI